ncbi:FtsJ-like methyltransferase-domain-containing protein [Kalaharituber pfeilii]|nr:FtsJ-like methyltransferase-domain-containing protein [Kalaharituber pfeilii]
MDLKSRALAVVSSALRPYLPFAHQLSPAASPPASICSLCLAAARSPWRPTSGIVPIGQRPYTSKSSKQWANRQVNDPYVKSAKIEGLRSRASWKLIELNHAHKFFKSGMTVVDLGYAPGSWTDVAVTATQPNGRVVGIDILPAVPPPGASTFQGNFLDERVQLGLRRFLANDTRGRPRHFMGPHGYFEAERAHERDGGKHAAQDVGKATVDVVLSDMLMNTSGITTKDQQGSMDLCVAALLFCVDVLKPGGDFLCKFYQGLYDNELETALKAAFTTVHREKPDSSRKESREQYFVGKKMKPNLDKNALLALMPSLQ